MCGRCNPPICIRKKSVCERNHYEYPSYESVVYWTPLGASLWICLKTNRQTGSPIYRTTKSRFIHKELRGNSQNLFSTILMKLDETERTKIIFMYYSYFCKYGSWNYLSKLYNVLHIKSFLFSIIFYYVFEVIKILREPFLNYNKSFDKLKVIFACSVNVASEFYQDWEKKIREYCLSFPLSKSSLSFSFSLPLKRNVYSSWNRTRSSHENCRRDMW